MNDSKTGLNGDLGGSYQFLQKLNSQLAGLWESEIMLSKIEAGHLQDGLDKVFDEAAKTNVKLEKFKKLSDLRERLNAQPQ